MTSFMAQAISEAERAAARGEVPVGAILVAATTGRVLAVSGNRTRELGDPTAHAEMMVIRAVNRTALDQCDLYVSLEPCAMCAAAISLARIRRLYFGAYDPKGGAVDHGPRWFEQATCLHRPEIYGGIEERRAGELLRRFFAALR